MQARKAAYTAMFKLNMTQFIIVANAGILLLQSNSCISIVRLENM